MGNASSKEYSTVSVNFEEHDRTDADGPPLDIEVPPTNATQMSKSPKSPTRSQSGDEIWDTVPITPSDDSVHSDEITTTCWTEDVLRIENLAVVCSNDEVDVVEVRELLLQRWKHISCQLDKGTILFMAGAHGRKDGKIDELEMSCRTIVDQVCMYTVCMY